MARVEVWETVQTFQIWPEMTFFGLDKSSAHTFKLPKQTTEALMRILELSEDKLQTDIRLNIGGKYYPATARVWRGNRKRPRKLLPEDLPERTGIMFSWSTFEVTIAAIRVALELAYSQVANGDKNNSQTATFVHIKNNEFSIIAS